MSFPVLLVLLLSAPIGSFMAAWADRHCAGLPLGALLRSSSCDLCGRPLAPSDLVPIVSWILQGGMCRGCGGQIPHRLLIAEIAAVLLGCLAVAATRGVWDLWAAAIFLWVLLGLALSDLRCFRLPDPMTLLLALAAFALAWVEGRLPLALVGAVLGGGVLWLLNALYRRARGRDGLGAGDVKLAAAIGIGLGPMSLPWIGLLAALVALGVSATGAFGHPERGLAVPFGLFLCLASMAVFAWRLVG
ncbi:A24 family peptidase [Ferrimonas balearica]|nr:A24 family peptidase [Ferrimonas balearica]